MWMSFFGIVLAIALGLAWGSVLLESETKNARRPARSRRAVRVRG
jgi:hypothetical protein